MAKKKTNRQDATLRNIRPLKKRVRALELRVKRTERWIALLLQRLHRSHIRR